MLSWWIWLTTHSRWLLIGESSSRSLLWIIIRRCPRWTILVLNMQAVTRIILCCCLLLSIASIVVVYGIAIGCRRVLWNRIEHVTRLLLATFRGIFSGIGSANPLWISSALLHAQLSFVFLLLLLLKKHVCLVRWLPLTLHLVHLWFILSLKLLEVDWFPCVGLFRSVCQVKLLLLLLISDLLCSRWLWLNYKKNETIICFDPYSES